MFNNRVYHDVRSVRVQYSETYTHVKLFRFIPSVRITPE